MNRYLLFLFLLLLSVNGYSVEPDLGSAQQREAGKGLYMKECSQCHGENGDGKGVAFETLRPWPRDFTKGVYKFKTTPDDRLPTTDDIMRIIRHGNPYTAMPAWPHLSTEEVRNLAYFLKSFGEDFSDPESLADEDVAPIPMEFPSSAPTFDEASAKKGKKLFKENKCIKCHGESGRGSGPSAVENEDMDGNLIFPRDLTKRWTFRSGHARLDIFRTLSTGISPMPSFHNLSEEDRWALVDYVYSLGERDDPQYGSVIIGVPVTTELDISKGEELFKAAPAVYLPVVGQVTQLGRAFSAATNGVTVKAIYNKEEIAFLLIWHDASKETSQQNRPDLKVPAFIPVGDPEAIVKETPAGYSDAVAIQLPSKDTKGHKRPYYIFGDKSNAVDLWFADLSQHEKGVVQQYVVHGANNFKKGVQKITFYAKYDDGRWLAIFKRKRLPAQGVTFKESAFTSMAFSFWDGFNNERGNKRGLTEWFNVYLKPMKSESLLLKMFFPVVICFVLEILIIIFMRSKHKDNPLC